MSARQINVATIANMEKMITMVVQNAVTRIWMTAGAGLAAHAIIQSAICGRRGGSDGRHPWKGRFMLEKNRLSRGDVGKN